MLPQNFNFDERFSHLERIGYIGGSALISELLASPLERTKIKLQTGPPTTSSFPFLSDIGTIINDIKSKEGLSKLYYGLKGSLDRQFIFNVSKFYSYYWLMDNICKNKKHAFLDTDVLASCIFGTSIATLASQPSDVLRLKMQGEAIGDAQSKTIGATAKINQIMKAANHPNGVFAGTRVNLVAQNLLAVTELFGFFAVRDELKKSYITRNEYVINGISALVASVLGTLVATPVDLIYTRIAFRDLHRKDTDMRVYLLHTLRSEGVSNLYKSFLPFLFKRTVFNLSMVTMLQYVTDRAYHKEGNFEGISMPEVTSPPSSYISSQAVIQEQPQEKTA